MKNKKTKKSGSHSKRMKGAIRSRASTRPHAQSKRKFVKHSIQKRRPLHRKVLLHPISVLLVLFVAVILFYWTFQVVADSTITVSANVPAAPLNTPAVITSPADGSTVTAQDIVVSGYCPIGSYVNLYNTSQFSGTGLCSNSGTFSIQMSLNSGLNTIVAHDYNVENQVGPDSEVISVTYSPPISQNQTSTATPTPLPLQITSNFTYQTFPVNNSFKWSVQIAGGTSPYTVTINWGGSQKPETFTSNGGVLTIAHTYSEQGYYPVLVTVTDSKGKSHILQVSALIKYPNAPTIYANSGKSSQSKQTGINRLLNLSKNWLWIAWPAIIIIFLMITSFWLGERQEIRLIMHKRNKKRQLQA